jgi:hypothetical protein
MSSSETFVAFGLVMLVVALLAVAIDWFGKPMKHRRFVPKMYRYPDERAPHRPPSGRTRQSVEADRARHGAVGARPDPMHLDVPVLTPIESASVALPAPLPPDGDGPTAPDDAAVAVGEAAVAVSDHGGPLDRRIGWSPGEYVFNLTADGSEPAPSTVRTRYWRNVAASPGSMIFGASNIERMRAGKAPQRRNPRTGRTEMMKLHAVTFEDTNGATPIPIWPDDSIDPFL